MHADIIDQQLTRIRSDLASRGVTYDALKDDLLDHICCMVEDRLLEGKDFNTSYREVMSEIEENRLSDIQHETLLLLDRKFQRMKRITYILGLTGSLLAIFGAFIKMLHWPGASILLTLGFLIVVLGFLPLYFIQSYREQTEKPNIIFPIVGYLSLLVVFTGAVFKIMHWPGADNMLRLSVIVLLVGFLPLYIVQIFKRSVKARVNPAYIIMLLVGIAVVLILSRVNLSKNAIDIYTDATVEVAAYTETLSNEVERMTSEAGDSVIISPELNQLMKLSDELEQLAGEMLGGLLASVDQEGVPISEVSRRDYRNGGKEAYNDNGLALEFLEKARSYRDMVLEFVHDPVVDGQVLLDFQFADDNQITGWNPEDDINDPLIINYKKITEFRYAVVHAEYLSVRHLLTK